MLELATAGAFSTDAHRLLARLPHTLEIRWESVISTVGVLLRVVVNRRGSSIKHEARANFNRHQRLIDPRSSRGNLAPNERRIVVEVVRKLPRRVSPNQVSSFHQGCVEPCLRICLPLGKLGAIRMVNLSDSMPLANEKSEERNGCASRGLFFSRKPTQDDTSTLTSWFPQLRPPCIDFDSTRTASRSNRNCSRFSPSLLPEIGAPALNKLESDAIQR